MKKIIVQLDSGRAPSLFDAVTAHDFGVDVVIPYGGIQPNEVADRWDKSPFCAIPLYP
jgi:hypothetical protein